MSQVKEFNPNDAQYQCCCGCHVLTGAKIVAGFAVAYTILELLSGVANILTGNPLVLISGLVSLAVVISLIYGLTKEIEGFLIPYMIYQIVALALIALSAIGVLILFFFFFAALSHAAKDKQIDVDSLGTAMYIALVVTLLLLVAWFCLQLWLFTIVKNAYCFIKNKRWADASRGGFVLVQQMEQVPNYNKQPPAYV